MKTIKYIILAVIILSTTMGSFSNLLAQENTLFAECYKRGELTAMLEKDDLFFSLLTSPDSDPEMARLGYCSEADMEKLWEHLHSKKIAKRFPEDLFFAWGWSPENGASTLYALKKSGEDVPGKSDLRSLSVQKSNSTTSYDLLISFSEEGAEKWAAMTKKNVGRNIAIIIEGKVVAAPSVREEIKFGKCMISGSYTKEEMNKMKTLLES